MKLKFYLFLLFGLFLTLGAKGQDFAIKTNLLYDATTTINLGVEAALSEKWTLDPLLDLPQVWRTFFGTTSSGWPIQYG